MRIAYLVFAYRNPRLLERLIARLSGDDSAFFIHIDAKSDIGAFAAIHGDNVFFSKIRIPVYWAEFSGVEAIMLLIRQALAAPEPYDYFVLLSGSEYPLRSRDYIHRYIDRHRGAEFINMAKMPAPGKPLSRINTRRPPSNSPVRRFALRALAKVGLARRDYRTYLGPLEPYSGITWWALTREACQYVSEFALRHPHVAAYFSEVFAPEETFIHTILGNSEFRRRIRRNLLFEDWSVPGGHPAIITGQHVDFFERSDRVCVEEFYGPGELLFARKFSDADTALLGRLDAMVARKEGRGSLVPATGPLRDPGRRPLG